MSQFDLNRLFDGCPRCPCGSGRPSWELLDARGIYISRVCSHCERKVKARYRPEIFTDSRYECDEPIEGEGDL